MNARQKTFGGGWSKLVNLNGRQVWLIVKKGRYVGKHFGNKCFEWHGTIYEDGKCLWAGSVDKSVSEKCLLSQIEDGAPI